MNSIKKSTNNQFFHIFVKSGLKLLEYGSLPYILIKNVSYKI